MAVLNEYILGFFCLVVGAFLWNKWKKSRNELPPGPTALPIIGNVLQVGRKPHLKFLEWAKKYGPIYHIKMGSMDVVVVTDYKLVKELFNDNASTGRMLDNPITYEFTKGPNGVVNSEGATWEAQRRFTFRTLKNFGFAKTSMEALILDEAKAMLDWFQKNSMKPIPGNRIFNSPVVNSLWRIVTGERCEWEESRPPVLDLADEFFSVLNEIATNGLFFAPVLRLIAPEYFGWNRYLKGVSNLFHLFEESIKKHKETFDPNNLRDFIDHHLLEIENSTEPGSSFYKEAGHTNMVAGVFDLFVGGSETTSHTLSWVLRYLSHFQKIQKKLQAEIDKVCGSRTPSTTDRVNMPYTEAVILEIMRASTVVSLGIPHRMKETKMFHGYNLPKGVAVFANLYGVHHDPEIWGDPEKFKPNRFLNEDGSKVVKNEALIPFAEGKRKCIGETLAKDTLFLFVTSIFQKFDVLREPGEEEKQNLSDFEPDIGYFLVPKPFKVVMSPRKVN